MALTSRIQLGADILSLFADNASGDISAADLRTWLTNLKDSIDHISEGGTDRSLEATISLASLKGNHYDLNGLARTGDLSISSSAILNGIAIVRHNDASVPAVTISGGGTLFSPIDGVSNLSDIYTTGQDNYLLFVCTNITPGALKVAYMPWGAAGSGGTMTGAQIKAAYEGETDTNAFTDALLAKLNGIPTAATSYSGTVVDISNSLYGSVASDATFANPSTATTFTVGATTERGYFTFWSQAASIPSFSGVTAQDIGYAANYQTNAKNEILGQWIGGELFLKVISVVSVAPSSNLVTDIPSLALWWDSTNLDGSNNATLTDGQEVLTIQDVHSTNVDGTAATGPTYLAVDQSLRFDGTNDYLANVGTGVTTQPTTVCVVFTPETGIANTDGIWGVDNAGSAPFLAWRVDGGDFVRLFGGTSFSANIPATIDTKMMITAVLNGASSAIYKDGNSSAVDTGDYGLGSLGNKIVWGAIQDSPAFLAHMKGFDLLVFDSALTTQELADLHSYMSSKHGF